MSKVSLGSDNHSGVHPQILAALSRVNSGHHAAYGTDPYSKNCTELIKSIFGEIFEPFFVFNGTAANVLCIQSLIESHEAVITASHSHLNIDECGAPEHIIGCKLLLVPSHDGKITPTGIEKHLIRLGDQHCAQPKVVSITLPTEYGTCYSYEELQELRRYTRKRGLFMHIDGARLIYAAHYLKKELFDLTGGLDVDAVSFGGTKNGLMFGEVALIRNEKNIDRFKYIRKQNMQLPSKMRFIAESFHELLKPPGLWRKIAHSGHELANYLRAGLERFTDIQVTQAVQANSVFVTIPKYMYKPLREEFFFYVWDEEKFEMRWMISFDVTKEDIDRFLMVISQLHK